jgi:hypothetical protein
MCFKKMETNFSFTDISLFSSIEKNRAITEWNRFQRAGTTCVEDVFTGRGAGDPGQIPVSSVSIFLNDASRASRKRPVAEGL